MKMGEAELVVVLTLGFSASGMRQRKAADSHGSQGKIATAHNGKT